jgi:hypothetical protein
MEDGRRPKTPNDDAMSEELQMGSAAEPPSWVTWRQAPAVVIYPPHLRKTAAIALIVGTLLFLINQLDVVLRGDATAVVWIKASTTYLVPFCVSNAGVLVASRRPMIARPSAPDGAASNKSSKRP